MELWLEPQATDLGILLEQELEQELELEPELEQDHQDREQPLVLEFVEESQSMEQELEESSQVPDQAKNQGTQKSEEQPTVGRHWFYQNPHHPCDRRVEWVDKQPEHNDRS